jgi:hypothetical protein
MNALKQFMKQCIFGIVLCYLVFSPALLAPQKAHAEDNLDNLDYEDGVLGVIVIDIMLNPIMWLWTYEDKKMQKEMIKTNVQKQTSLAIGTGQASPIPQGNSSSEGTFTGLIAGIPVTLASGAANFKTAMKTFVKSVISNVLGSITSWAQQGFRGKPNFIADWKGMLRASALDASAEFIQSMPGIANLCSPQSLTGSKNFFNKALTVAKPTFSKYVQKEFKPANKCTLETVVNNIGNAPGNFKNSVEKLSKGWDVRGGSVMASALMAPDVNMLGAYFISKDESLGRTKQNAEAKKEEAAANKGFLNITDGCIGAPDPDTGEKYCPAKMAGTFVKDSLTKTGLGQFSDVIDMNDMNDLFVATMQQIMASMTSSVSSALSGYINNAIKGISM